MTELKTRPFDPAAYMETAEDFAFFLNDAVETADPAYIAEAIGTVARARGLTTLALELGVARPELVDALNGFEAASLDRLTGLARALERSAGARTGTQDAAPLQAPQAA